MAWRKIGRAAATPLPPGGDCGLGDGNGLDVVSD